jgi:hypothetical protein
VCKRRAATAFTAWQRSFVGRSEYGVYCNRDIDSAYMMRAKMSSMFSFVCSKILFVHHSGKAKITADDALDVFFPEVGTWSIFHVLLLLSECLVYCFHFLCTLIDISFVLQEISSKCIKVSK